MTGFEERPRSYCTDVTGVDKARFPFAGRDEHLVAFYDVPAVDLEEVLHEETRAQERIGHVERPQAAFDPPVWNQGIALDAEYREVDEMVDADSDRCRGGVEHPIGRDARRKHEEEPIDALERAAPGLGPFEVEADVLDSLGER